MPITLVARFANMGTSQKGRRASRLLCMTTLRCYLYAQATANSVDIEDVAGGAEEIAQADVGDAGLADEGQRSKRPPVVAGYPASGTCHHRFPGAGEPQPGESQHRGRRERCGT